VLFARSSVDHDYHCCSFATEGAARWLGNVEIKYTTPAFAAQQMDGYMISGCHAHVKKTRGGMYHIPIANSSIYLTIDVTVDDAKEDPKKARHDCRTMIQTGLGAFTYDIFLEKG
jgi:hypothetical protein